MGVEAIFLYVILHDDNSNDERFRVQMPSIEECLKAVEIGKIAHPNNTGADYEVMGIMFCGSGNFHRNSDGAWRDDPVLSK